MNRIFDPEEPIDLTVEPEESDPGRTPAHTTPAVAELRSPTAADRGPAPPSATLSAVPGAASVPPGSAVTAAASRRRRQVSIAGQSARHAQQGSGRLRRLDERLVLIGTLCGVCLASVVGSLLYFGHWTRLQQAISQERNLLLLERLRNLGPATPSPVQGPEPAAPLLPAPAAAGSTASDADPSLPPPPPQEPWIEQLSSLPETPPAARRVLTVPVSPRLAAAAPPARGSASPSPAQPAVPLPQLVGVVAGAGRAPSAIFLVGGSSMSVSSGEQIGATGWRLRSAEGETVLIERGGELRQVSIASGNGF